jgi:ANTAR domain
MAAEERRRVIEQACGVLVLALKTSPAAALGDLERLAARDGYDLETIAYAVVSAASGARITDPSMRALMSSEEWGGRVLLDSSRRASAASSTRWSKQPPSRHRSAGEPRTTRWRWSTWETD